MAEVKSEKALGVRDGTLETEKSSHLDAEGRATKPEDDPEDEYPRGLPFVLLTIGLMAVVLVVALDNYIISTAIPELTTDFKDLSLVGWYGSSYFLTLMSFQPAFGQLCTLFPVKRVTLVSILVFEIGSIISAAAPTSVAFIVGRLVSGAASGGLWCGVLTLLGYAVPVSKRHLYVSIVTSMYGVASAAGPLLGGVFTDSPRLTWRFCFWINLPIGFAAFVLIAVFCKPPRQTQLSLKLSVKEKLKRLDLLGILLLIAGFACLLLALQWGGVSFSWSDSRVWGCLLGFGLLILAFAALQVYLKDSATLPIRILRERTPLIGCTFVIFLTMAIGVHIYYLPFYFQSVQGVSARTSGIRTLPYLMSLLFAPLLSGTLITLLGHYVPFMWAGSCLLTIGSGLLFTLHPNSTEGEWVGYQVLAAFGAGICRQIAFSAVPLVLERDDFAVASALVAFCNALGPTLAIGLGQSVFMNEFSRLIEGVQGIVDVGAVVNMPADMGRDVPAALIGVVREAFNFALTRAFALSIASAGVAFGCSLGMEWISVKEKH